MPSSPSTTTPPESALTTEPQPRSFASSCCTSNVNPHLRLQRDELAREVSEQQRRLTTGTPDLTPEKIRALGMLLRDKLFTGPPEFRQAYARVLMSEVAVTRDEIRITGSKSILARCASTELGDVAPTVLSFVQKWRPRQDSNLRPSV